MKSCKALFTVSLIIILCLVNVIAFAASDTVYVDTVSGNDSNSGSASAPFKTMNKAMEQVNEGGTIFASGVFDHNAIQVTKSVSIKSTTGAVSNGSVLFSGCNENTVVTIEGFTFPKNCLVAYAGANVPGTLTLSNCLITNPTGQNCICTCNELFADAAGTQPITDKSSILIPKLSAELKNRVPQTGDNSNITLWISLMAISALSFVALGRKSRFN